MQLLNVADRRLGVNEVDLCMWLRQYLLQPFVVQACSKVFALVLLLWKVLQVVG